MKTNAHHNKERMLGESGTNRVLEREVGRPEWIRLPKSGERCPHTGLSRSSLNELILGKPPKVESVVLKNKGALRGIRLVRYRSLIAYLDRLASEQEQE
jgi:hypothetical protein